MTEQRSKDFSPQEAEARFEATLRGALKAPPQHREAPKKPIPKKRGAYARANGASAKSGMNAARQPTLFEVDRVADDQQAVAARLRMREMIERLKATSVPYWRDEAAVILDDGAFQRAMRLVPHEEAQVLWADFDTQMERLYAIWAAACASPLEAAPGQ